MKIKDLNKEELQEVTKIYIKERHTAPWLCSLEEFCESFVRKCECCGELVVVDDGDKELPVYTNFKGEKCHMCENCIPEEEYTYEPDYYDEYTEFHRMEMI